MSRATMKYVALILVPSDVQTSYQFISKREFEDQMRSEGIRPIYKVEFIYPPAEPRQQSLKLKLQFPFFTSKFASLRQHLTHSGVVGVLPSSLAEDCTDLNPSTYNTDKELIKLAAGSIRETMLKIDHCRSFSHIGLQDTRSLSFYNLDPRNCVIHLVPLSMAPAYRSYLEASSKTSIINLHQQAREEQQFEEEKKKNNKRKASSDEEDDDDDDSGFFSAFQVKKLCKVEAADEAAGSTELAETDSTSPRPEAADEAAGSTELAEKDSTSKVVTSNEAARAEVAPMLKEKYWHCNEMFKARLRK